MKGRRAFLVRSRIGQRRRFAPGARPLAALLVVAGFAALAGCGQKGPLVLPDRASPTAPQTGSPAGETTENDDDDERERRARDDGR